MQINCAKTFLVYILYIYIFVCLLFKPEITRTHSDTAQCCMLDVCLTWFHSKLSKELPLSKMKQRKAQLFFPSFLNFKSFSRIKKVYFLDKMPNKGISFDYTCYSIIWDQKIEIPRKFTVDKTSFLIPGTKSSIKKCSGFSTRF